MRNLDIQIEKNILQSNYDLVVGVDEAGRGPWAGPVSIAAYFFTNESLQIQGVNDSKKLSIKKRESLFPALTTDPKIYKSKLIDSKVIDKYGVGKTIELAITSIIQEIKMEFASQSIKFLIDGYFKTNFDCDYELIKGGDSKVYSIAAASVIAKVIRDHEMMKYAKLYPVYGFDKHVGYGTKQHIESIDRYGLCPIHRRSFKPLKKLYLASST